MHMHVSVVYAYVCVWLLLLITGEMMSVLHIQSLIMMILFCIDVNVFCCYGVCTCLLCVFCCGCYLMDVAINIGWNVISSWNWILSSFFLFLFPTKNCTGFSLQTNMIKSKLQHNVQNAISLWSVTYRQSNLLTILGLLGHQTFLTTAASIL